MKGGGSSPRLRVLLIAFHYPPEGGSGSQRALKFSRYLPEFGCDVEVLTACKEVHCLFDYSLLKEIPTSVVIHRARGYDFAKFAAIRGRYPGTLAFPDRYLSWFPFATHQGWRLLRNKRFDAILSTSPIRTAHLIGWALSRLRGLPWICDFRDPWLAGVDYATPRFRLLAFLERGLLRMADRIIVNTSHARQTLLDRVDLMASRNVSVIPNGYDESDFERLDSCSASAPRRLTILHTGEIYPDLRDPRPLLKVVSKLIGLGEIQCGELLIRFIGAGPALENEEFHRWLKEQNLEGTVTVEAHVGHAACVREMVEAQALLLLQCSSFANTQVPAKVFEYLRAGQPVLAVAPLESATAEILRTEAGCWVVRPDDDSAIENAIIELISRHRSGASGRVADRGRQYERKVLTGRLAELFYETVRDRRTGVIDTSDQSSTFTRSEECESGNS